MWTPTPDHPLRKMFAGITEHAFLVELGVTDIALVDYLADMLTRFLHMDEVCKVRNRSGQFTEEVAEMLREAESLPGTGSTRREVYRYIGDYTLFWTGLYPEVIQKRHANHWATDHFIDYCRSGKQCYLIAGSFENDPWAEESAVLKRLSKDFEMCAYGLNQVRKEFEVIG